MYYSFAYYIGSKLHIRPQEILDTWSVPELIVAYGNYANEDANKVFQEWKALEPKQRNKVSRPREYAVMFVGVI